MDTQEILNVIESLQANAIVYHKRKPVWDTMDDSIPTFNEMPPPR